MAGSISSKNRSVKGCENAGIIQPTRPRVRLAVVDSHPIQYHYQYFRLLAEAPDIELMVFYCWDTREGVQDPNYGKVKWDVPVLEGYPYHFARNWSPCPGPGDRFFAQINPELTTLLTPDRFDVVWVWGYSTLSAWLAVVTARARGLRILFRGEATLDVPRSWWRRLVKEAVVRGFLKMVDGVAFSCAANRRYYEHYGVPDKALIFSACSVDNFFFQEYALGLDRQACKVSLGLPVVRPVLLFIGRLEERKRPLDLIQAVAAMQATVKPTLLLVGDGPLRATLEGYCRQHGLLDVRFLGFRNQSELPVYYGSADVVLVVSTSDPSPKVLNEAMNFGLPSVVSDRVGTAGDLVVDGWNGFVVPCGDVGAIAQACERILTDPSLAQRMSENARNKIDEWSFESGTAAIEHWLLEARP